ncbi:hypothetical protein PV327_001746 [Microctonus hyperodae]|uniref:Uncharacterized protein n=1 Tax=Microctonus hyperodae TaxID=165561 RepID=A0AA39KNL2_MICHY|nr:hypothetical protein PV327_001746 [Microctonus hyperodae]
MLEPVDKSNFIRVKPIIRKREISSRNNHHPRKLSIITDTEINTPIYPRRKKKSSSVLLSSPPYQPSSLLILSNTKDNSNDLVKNITETSCKSKIINGWYQKLKREILKSFRTKIVPEIIINPIGCNQVKRQYKCMVVEYERREENKKVQETRYTGM